MTFKATLDATGRDMVNAINAGKVVMVRAVDTDGTTYFVMPSIGFVDSDSEDYFYISFPMGLSTYRFYGSLDDTIVCSSAGSSNSGDIK